MMKSLSYIFFFIILCVFAYWTHERNNVYRSELSLWQDAEKKSPFKPRVLVNLAFAYKERGEEYHALGVDALTRAIQISPDLILYFKALKYAHENDGKLITEKDVWNRGRRSIGGDAPVVQAGEGGSTPTRLPQNRKD